MAMRDAVAVDFMGVGGAGGSSPDCGGGGEDRVRLVRPIPSGGGARRSPVPEAAHPFTSHGLRLHSWSRGLGKMPGDEDKVMVSPKQERDATDGPLSVHHKAEPAGRHDGFAHRKTAAMYAGHHQAPRGLQVRSSEQPQPPSNQGGFGSPAPFYGRARQAGGAENGGAAAASAMAGKRPPTLQNSLQAGNLPRPAGTGKQPQTAQLTIFYAGMVNVYDEVPYDKAQAIMLLAGSGNSWSSSYMNPPASGGAPARPFSAPMAVPQSTAPTTSAAPPTRPVVPGVVFSNARPAPVQNVELPQARKASLARFLEKRKDRVRKVPVKEEGEASPSRDRSPGPSESKPATRSPSPAPLQDHPRHQAGASSCSEPGSPTRPPGTPPRLSISEERSAGTPPKRRDLEAADQNASKRARSGHSPPRKPGGGMDDDSSSR